MNLEFWKKWPGKPGKNLEFENPKLVDTMFFFLIYISTHSASGNDDRQIDLNEWLFCLEAERELVDDELIKSRRKSERLRVGVAVDPWPNSASPASSSRSSKGPRRGHNPFTRVLKGGEVLPFPG